MCNASAAYVSDPAYARPEAFLYYGIGQIALFVNVFFRYDVMMEVNELVDIGYEEQQ